MVWCPGVSMRHMREMEIEERERRDEDEAGEGFSGWGFRGFRGSGNRNEKEDRDDKRRNRGGCVTGHVRRTPGWRVVMGFARLGEKKRAGPAFFYLGWFPFF